jgi:hypothetical protein
MSQTVTQIDPLNTSCVLKHFGLAIDEIKLVRSIDSLNQLVNESNARQLESGRKHYLISELRFLNKRLQSVREKANTD